MYKIKHIHFIFTVQLEQSIFTQMYDYQREKVQQYNNHFFINNHYFISPEHLLSALSIRCFTYPLRPYMTILLFHSKWPIININYTKVFCINCLVTVHSVSMHTSGNTFFWYVLTLTPSQCWMLCSKRKLFCLSYCKCTTTSTSSFWCSMR